MARVFVKDTELQDIADAIREKNGMNALYKPAEMVAAILDIESGGGGGGIDAIKCIDVDITVDASTSTATNYTVDGLEMISSVENPTKYNAFKNDAYIALVTPKELTGQETGNTERVYRKSLHLLNGHTNYASSVINFLDYSIEFGSVSQGICSAQLYADSVVNNKIIGHLTVTVRHDTNGNYEVVAGTYNIQVFYLASFSGGVS